MLGFWDKVKSGFVKTRQKLWNRLSGQGAVPPEQLDQLEANLYGADFGPEVVEGIMGKVRSAQGKSVQLETFIRQALEDLLQGADGALQLPVEKPQLVLLLGVNGAGKTTTAAKIAHYLKLHQQRVLLGSCDTFRAAADQQLKLWAEKIAVDCVGSHYGADAAAVAHDTCQAGIHRHCDWVILDTAGRLHNKSYLMEELKKMVRVVNKFNDSFAIHKWLVVDGSLGTNSITQAKLFNEAVGLTGLIVTKLDGSSKGGAVVGIYDQLKTPVYFIGLGESCDDLQPFSSKAYVDAIVQPMNSPTI